MDDYSNTPAEIIPFENCPALDGYHCITNSLAKIYSYYGHPLSEDMGFLPWFHFPVEYHFGGHSFVVCGYDGKETVLASDMDNKSGGLKKGFYFPITLNQLAVARNSRYKPFPAENKHLEFDFSGFRLPGTDDICSSIRQTVGQQMNPPIRNIGVKGILHSAKELLKWPGVFGDHDLRMNLFSLYVFIEIGGTGGGCFRHMYARFLEEASHITGNKGLLGPADKIRRAGELFSEIAHLFIDSETAQDLNERIRKASGIFCEIAKTEESAYLELAGCI